MIRFAFNIALLLATGLNASNGPLSAQDPTTVKQALSSAIRYYTDEAAVNGGYVYYYSPDFTRRLGEGVASKTQIWVQPPGTPTVGLALLNAYDVTKERSYLDAANRAAKALIHGQLKSGAWTNSVDFDPRGKTAEYLNGKGSGRNFSTLDDGITQSALKFLMRCDQANSFGNSEVSNAVSIALDALLAAQFVNGAFPQGWDGPVSVGQKITRARFPDYDWRVDGRIKEYWDMYTLNDGLAGTVVETLIVAHEVYGRDDCRNAVLKFGDFLIMAQLPEPQPGWAQQYSYSMIPIWARRFEPPAVAGRESQDVLEALIRIHEFSGEARYLAPVEPALDYLERSQLADGRLSRYYELKTNRPLYMSRTGRDYKLTYDDSRLPNHYGWKVENRVDDIRTRHNRVSSGRSLAVSKIDSSKVRSIIDALDEQGRWVSRYSGESLVGQPKFRDGEQYLSSAVFSANVNSLSEFLRQQQ